MKTCVLKFSILNCLPNSTLGYLLLSIGYFLSNSLATASPSSALREYNSGHYDQSLKEYEQLLEKKSDDPRLHYNAGNAAYRSRKFDEAAKQFTNALTAPDLKLQQQAYYNLGNSLFHLGEANPDPSKRTETWEQSLKSYQGTLNLNPTDADAKFNYQFVKKKLEELKQQQQQQKQNDKDKSDQQKDQDQQQQQNQQKQDQKDKNQQSQDQNKQDQKEDSSQKDQQQAQQPKPDDKDKQQQQQQADQSKEQKEKEEQQQKQSQPKDKSDEKNQQQPAQTYAAAQMTLDQAKQLLDAQKGEEAVLPIKPTEKPKSATRSLKDW